MSVEITMGLKWDLMCWLLLDISVKQVVFIVNNGYVSQVHINEINQFEYHTNHNANTYELSLDFMQFVELFTNVSEQFFDM